MKPPYATLVGLHTKRIPSSLAVLSNDAVTNKGSVDQGFTPSWPVTFLCYVIWLVTRADFRFFFFQFEKS